MSTASPQRTTPTADRMEVMTVTMRMRRAGFTLVEVLVVAAIITLILAITIPAFNSYSANRDQNSCMINLRKLGVALIEYHDDYGHYPPAVPTPYLSQSNPNPEYLPFAHPLPVLVTSGNTSAMTVTAQQYTGTTDRRYEVQGGLGVGQDQYAWTGEEFDTATNTWTALPGGSGTIASTVDIGDHVILNFSQPTYTSVRTWKFYVSPAPAGIETWMPSTTLSNDTVLGGATLDVASAAAFSAGDTLIIRNAASTEYVTVQSISSNTVTLNQGLLATVPYQVADTNVTKMVYGNQYGLATLYKLYLDDQRDYMKSYHTYHCPSMLSTKDVDRLGVLNSFMSAKAFRCEFDPLWNGYNTYDVTYNYSQFDNEIAAFSTSLGVAGLHTPRQLKHANAPPDTVVTWCPAHRKPQTIDWALLQPDGKTPTAGAPALKIADPNASVIKAGEKERYAKLLTQLLDDLESGGRPHRRLQEINGSHTTYISDILIDGLKDCTDPTTPPDLSGGMYYGMKSDVVLWLDGTVSTEQQRLVRGPDAGMYRTYHWMPPYLYTRGDERE